MTMPTVHLNGTSKGELSKQCENAADKLREALKALYEMRPNGRDYYLKPGAITSAQQESDDRIHRVHSVLDEVHRIWDSIEGGAK